MIGCLCELKNVKSITRSEHEKENTGQKLNATETIREANNGLSSCTSLSRCSKAVLCTENLLCRFAVFSHEGSSSSTDYDTGLRSRRSWVQIPAGPPPSSYILQIQAKFEDFRRVEILPGHKLTYFEKCDTSKNIGKCATKMHSEFSSLPAKTVK